MFIISLSFSIAPVIYFSTSKRLLWFAIIWFFAIKSPVNSSWSFINYLDTMIDWDLACFIIFQWLGSWIFSSSRSNNGFDIGRWKPLGEFCKCESNQLWQRNLAGLVQWHTYLVSSIVHSEQNWLTSVIVIMLKISVLRGNHLYIIIYKILEEKN